MCVYFLKWKMTIFYVAGDLRQTLTLEKIFFFLNSLKIRFSSNDIFYISLVYGSANNKGIYCVFSNR